MSDHTSRSWMQLLLSPSEEYGNVLKAGSQVRSSIALLGFSVCEERGCQFGNLHDDRKHAMLHETLDPQQQFLVQGTCFMRAQYNLLQIPPCPTCWFLSVFGIPERVPQRYVSKGSTRKCLCSLVHFADVSCSAAPPTDTWPFFLREDATMALFGRRVVPRGPSCPEAEPVAAKVVA